MAEIKNVVLIQKKNIWRIDLSPVLKSKSHFIIKKFIKKFVELPIHINQRHNLLLKHFYEQN